MNRNLDAHRDELKRIKAGNRERTNSKHPRCSKQDTQPAVLYHFKQFRLDSKLGEWVPHNLASNQIKKRVDYCRDLLSLHRNTEWLIYLITWDEK